MPNDWVPRNPDPLGKAIDKLINALNNAAGQAASGVPATRFTNLQNLRTAMTTSVTNRDNLGGQLDAAQDVMDESVIAAIDEYRTVGKSANESLNMTNELRALSGLPIHDTQPSPGELPVVNDVVVIPRPNGNNFVDWTGPTGGGLLYLVFSRRDTETQWTQVGASTRTDFTHRDAGAGVRRHYYVVSQRGNRTSEPGNTATAYA